MTFSWTQIVEEHDIIRETVGYDIIKDIDIVDLPTVLEFLQIVWNYDKMIRLNAKN